jgi:uncharacterized protein YecE (DUF72 family)
MISTVMPRRKGDKQPVYYLGTSGWSYPDWRERFYPAGLGARNWLEHYSRQFDSVEVNMTFYRFPKPETLEAWLERTPPGFTFTLKAPKQITHLKKLKKVKSDVHYFDLLAGRLGDKLGCLLFQLPPSLTRDLALLKEFLECLPAKRRNVVEFRHESWYDDKVYELLRAHRAAFCIVSSRKVPDAPVVTSATAYFRFHGLTGGFRYNYSNRELSTWAETIRSVDCREAFIYFNNDYHAHAVANALKLGKFLA